MTDSNATPKAAGGQGGFTLIETLIAVLILATAIAGPLTIASKGLSAALVAKDQTTAYYLAQDAVEYVRFARDTNTLHSGWDWLTADGDSDTSTNLSACKSSNACYFDSLGNSPTRPTQCSSPSACPLLKLYKDPSTGRAYFTYATGANITTTIFTRTVKITTPVGANDCVAPNGCEAGVEVTVTWSDLPGVVHSVVLREEIYDWQ